MPGDTLWAKSFGDSAAQTAYGVAFDPAGNLYISGLMAGTMKVGQTTLTSTGTDVFLISLDPSGSPRWAKSFPIGSTNSYKYNFGLVADASGVTLAGSAGTGEITQLGAASPSGVFVAKFSLDGSYIWSLGCGGEVSTVAQAPFGSLALDAAGDVIFSAPIAGVVASEGIKCGTLGIVRGIAAVKVNAVGQPQWAVGTSSGYDHKSIASADSAGNTYHAWEGMLAKRLAANGTSSWTFNFGGTNVIPNAIANTSTGKALVAGDFTGTASFGAPVTAQGKDIFLLQLDDTGALLKARTLGPDAHLTGLRVDSADSGILAGGFSGMLDVGTETLVATTVRDTFVVKTKKTAETVWAKSYAIGEIKALATDAGGRIAVVGSFVGTQDFGGVILDGLGSGDVFVMVLSP